ncbi:hypothetical protein [Hymenobacter nivis]|uniref:hypothetical protein n=1 Tax=Hymenobacter nivis TaxID=1850093 RepID=UPI00112970C5|nr:hypothetical protein [Hymenobacter nivis]
MLNYFFYCFYCLASAKRFDRAEAAVTVLAFLLGSLLIDIYTIIAATFVSKVQFKPVLIILVLAMEWWIHRIYFRPKLYEKMVARYAQGEPHRLRYALAGVVLLLVIIFLPFLVLKTNYLLRASH